MRVFGAIFLSTLLIAGTWWYTKFADSVRRTPPEIQVKLDNETWKIKIDRTFDCIPDVDSEFPAIKLVFKGREIFNAATPVPRTQNVEIGDIPEVEQGSNELYLAAVMATLDDFEFDSSQANAIRVQLYRGFNLIDDVTIWSEPGSTMIEETIIFNTPSLTAPPDHEHEHD